MVGVVTGSTKVGDAYVKDLTINLQKTMLITAHEITATKSANNKGVITYGFAVKAASQANANVEENKAENAPVAPAQETAAPKQETSVTENLSSPIPDIPISGCKTFALAGHVGKVTCANGDYVMFDRNGNLTEEKKKGDNMLQRQYENPKRYNQNGSFYNIVITDTKRTELYDSEVATDENVRLSIMAAGLFFPAAAQEPSLSKSARQCSWQGQPN